MAKVKFIKSPSCAPFHLAYHTGDEAEVQDEIAVKLITAKFATPITSTQKVKKATVKQPKKETRSKKAAPKK